MSHLQSDQLQKHDDQIRHSLGGLHSQLASTKYLILDSRYNVFTINRTYLFNLDVIPFPLEQEHTHDESKVYPPK